MKHDRVTTLGTGVDGAVRRLTAVLEAWGLASKLTSYDNATVGSGSIVNEFGLTYNSFGQLVTDAQSHNGAVVPGTTPTVQFAYANGSANMIRPTTLTYPNGRDITISCGTELAAFQFYAGTVSGAVLIADDVVPPLVVDDVLLPVAAAAILVGLGLQWLGK